jgi:hypothetical protein
MALEDLTGSDKFITDLVPANPAGGDDRREGDNHIRGIKNVLINTFPNVDGQVTLTTAQFNALVNAVLNAADAYLNTITIGNRGADSPFVYSDGAGVLNFRAGLSTAQRYWTLAADGTLSVPTGAVIASGNVQTGQSLVGRGLLVGNANDGQEKQMQFNQEGGIAGPYFYLNSTGAGAGMYWPVVGNVWQYDRSSGNFGFIAPTSVRARQFTATPSP